MTDYQDLFDRARRETDSNDYGQLCGGIWAVFEAAGYHPVAQPRDLADRFHNEVVGLIGLTDLTAVARGFCANWDQRLGWPLSYDLNELEKGRIPWRAEQHRQLPTLSQAPGWAAEVGQRLREERIRRGTKNYRAFVAQRGHMVHHRLLTVAEREIEQWHIRAADAALELLEESARLARAAGYYRQGRDIALALLAVTGLADTGRLADRSEDRARRIEAGLAGRQSWADSLLAYVVSVAPETVVEAALRPYPSLTDLWEQGATNA
ncbi:MAG: hypothetical protein KKA73_28785 [Chloroflexi bacterium]|nr:hypothetical protein [Chloroflexota bacterium]